MTATAFWRRLDTPGHDAAILRPTRRGWSLRGTAVFLSAEGPACLAYAVELDAGWCTRQGRVQGFAGPRPVDHRILRTADGWTLDGVPAPGLGHLLDLDFAFTPATNLTHLRRVAPAVGQTVDIPVAWFDIGRPLTELPQRYERRGETSYWYSAPTEDFAGALELAANGFALSYPELWEMEPRAGGSACREEKVT